MFYDVVINLEMSILQAFCELSLSAISKNTSFVHKLFEDAGKNCGVPFDDDVLNHVSDTISQNKDVSLTTYDSLNGKKLFLPTLQSRDVTVK